MGQGLPELRMTFGDRAVLERELESNLTHGRAFVTASCSLAVLDDCTLVLVHPDGGGTLALPAQAVMVGGGGVGIQLRPFNASTIATLREFVASPPMPVAAAAAAAAQPSVAASPASSATRSAVPSLPPEEPDAEPPPASSDDGDEVPSDAELDAQADSEDDLAEGADGAAARDKQRQKPRHERLRNLNATQQVKLARKGEMNDRITLERLYGRGVWEALLQNSKITLPEVATIARKGSVPRPLLELIVDNNAWIQSPLVRRALLTNPRVTNEAVLKLLRMTPKHELRSIWKTTTYSQMVRETAKKVLEM